MLERHEICTIHRSAINYSTFAIKKKILAQQTPLEKQVFYHFVSSFRKLSSQAHFYTLNFE